MILDIRELLSRRSDLSTFIVHLTRRTEDGNSPRQNLKLILEGLTIEARNAFGPAASLLRGLDRRSQECVSFSETPLEHLHCLTREIPKRRYKLSPYGLAFTKQTARLRSVNPVWYVDITAGHDWLMVPINKMIKKEVQHRKKFRKSPLALFAPFIEQMGTGPGYRKEFWWEREWRHRGDFHFFLEDVVIGLAPESRIEAFEQFSKKLGRKVPFVDPKWSLERIIAHLAGCGECLTPFD